MSAAFAPAELIRRTEPFDDPAFLYELKYDGFRALAHVSGSRHSTRFLAPQSVESRALRESLRSLRYDVVLDGEVVVLDATGRPQFYEPLRRRGQRLSTCSIARRTRRGRL